MSYDADERAYILCFQASDARWYACLVMELPARDSRSAAVMDMVERFPDWPTIEWPPTVVPGRMVAGQPDERWLALAVRGQVGPEAQLALVVGAALRRWPNCPIVRWYAHRSDR